MQLLTIKELSNLLKVKEKTIYQWAAIRQIPCIKLNGSLRFDHEDILAWVESSKKEADTGYNELVTRARASNRIGGN
ncbi:MAG: helix-turn-helix domain-containing protein [Thermodesulfovibrionia bacterium]|nr:helix-turn-helix domain-containing protein [Thermodesulfovibrionia bacterium]